MTTDPELVPVAQGDDLLVVAWMDEKHAWPTHRAPSAPGTHALMLVDDHARIVAELEAESHRRLRIAEDTAAIATEFQRRYKEAKAELAALRARVEAAPVGKLVGMEHSASNLVYRVALHGPKQNGPELLTVVRLLAAPAGGEG